MKYSSLSKLIVACAETLTAMCIYYVIAVAMIVTADVWSINIIWIVILPIIFTVMWRALLEKPKTVPFITAITGVLFVAQIAFYIWISKTPMNFRYLAMIAVGAGMGIGLPLNYTLKEVKIQKHLMTIDYMVLCTAALFLVKDALNIGNSGTVVMVLVLILDICAAAFLRINENDSVNAQDASKAIWLTICCAAVPAALTILFSMIFSRSGKAVQGIFSKLGDLLIKIWNAVENALKWLFAHFDVNNKYESLEIEEVPSIAAAENELGDMSLNINATAIGITAACIIIIALVIVALLMRKRRIKTNNSTISNNTSTVERKRFNQISLWERFKAYLHLELTIFKHRNTAAGIMIYLEKRGRLKKQRRKKSETMRSYIERLDKEKQLTILADALDKIYYGESSTEFTVSDCSKMRRYIRRIVQ